LLSTTAAGKLVFGIFVALAEFERDLITERKPKMLPRSSGLPWRAWKGATRALAPCARSSGSPSRRSSRMSRRMGRGGCMERKLSAVDFH
jgi:hypothetical protein